MKKWILVAALLMAGSQPAVSEEFNAGTDYEKLQQPLAVQTGDRIEVRELFWYGCPHCYALEPYIHRWLQEKPENAEYVPFPAVLNNSWEFHARAYFTFEALGLVDELHGPFFDSIHKDGERIRSADALAQWASGHGADPQAIRSAYDSFAVDTKTRQARMLTREYGISGVPSIIVDGKYRTSASMAGGGERLFALVNFLVEKSAAER